MWFPIGVDELELQLPQSFDRDSDVIFRAFARVTTVGISLARQRNGSAANPAEIRETAARLGWLAGLYFSLAFANCDDWEERSRDELEGILWDSAGAIAGRALEDGEATPDFERAVEIVSRIKTAPGARRVVPRVMHHLVIMNVTAELVPSSHDALNRLVLDGRATSCDAVMRWARESGAHDASNVRRGKRSAHPWHDQRGVGANRQTMADILFERLGAQLPWDQIIALAEAYDAGYVGMLAA